MKLSTNFVKDYVDIDVDVKTLAEDMTRVGNEYDAAGKLINATKLVIGEIIECEDHPDSDHLHLCKVNIGTEILNIVCGAPNARKGLKVIVAQDGAQLPEITIKKGMIRGQESNGMLCSLAELGLDNKFLTQADKNGISELGADAVVGENPIKYLEMDDDVIDFELTANRGDLLSILGMAYEIGAIYDKPVKEVDLRHNENGEDINKSFSVEVKTDNCKMFLAKKVENVVIKESPAFIKNRLIASGIRPINNVVDISNYVMLELGQPLHFYDADRLGNKIVVRMAEPNEKLTTLDEIERELTETDIVIADATHGVGLAGVMGGLETEVEEDTKNVVIEAAIFDSVKVRLTSKKILRSEASNRFEKGLDPARTYMAIERACHLLEKYADAKIVSGMISHDKTDKCERHITVSLNEINSILGMTLNNSDVEGTLDSLGFDYEVENDVYEVIVPNRRQDIVLQKEDIIEEVGRIYGYDNIVPTLPVARIKKGEYSESAKYRKIVSKRMRSLGFNELRTYTLVSLEESNKYNYNFGDFIKLNRPMLKEKSVIRQSLVNSLTDVVKYNLKNKNKDVFVYEIANTYSGIDEYVEDTKLAFVLTGKYMSNTWNNNCYMVDFYFAKGVIENILDYLGLENRYTLKLSDKLPKEIHPKINSEIIVGGKSVGYFGKLHPSEIKQDVYVCEISLSKLILNKTGDVKFKELNKYPKIEKDLAFIVSDNVDSYSIINEIKKSGGKLLTDVKVFDIYKGDKLDKNKKSIAFNLTFEDYSRTLTEDEVMVIFNNIIRNVENKLNVTLRDK